MLALPESSLKGTLRLAQWDPESDALNLINLSLHPRFGLRGPDAVDFCHAQHIPLAAAVNRAEHTAKGETVLRLGKTETWVLAGSEVSLYFNHWQQKLEHAEQAELYPLYNQHSHAWLMLTGNPTARAELMAKLCGVDMREAAMPLGCVVQSSVARVSAVVAHHLFAKRPVFSVLCDISLAQYMADALLDAIAHP